MRIKRTLIVLINGVANWPGRSKNWNGRGVTWFHLNSDYVAEKVEYFSSAILTRLFKSYRIDRLQTMLSYYHNDQVHDWEIILVGHSNGCNVIMGVIEKLRNNIQDIKIKEVHLIAAASENDFAKNGLQFAQLSGMVGTVHIYQGGADRALWWAGKTKAIFGFGSLGLHGPKNHVEEQTQTITYPSFGHSDWFENGFFDTMMRMVRDGPKKFAQRKLAA